MDPHTLSIVIGFSILASEGFVAFLTIGFILSIILLDFCRKKKIRTKDKIQVFLKVSSIIFTIAVNYSEFSNALQPTTSRLSHPNPVCSVIIVFCMFSCSWLIAIQCFFYFIKIVHFRCLFIPWMRMKIGSIVSWQIVVVELMSLVMSLLYLLTRRMAQISSTNSSYISSTDMTTGEMIMNDDVLLFLLFMVGLPLVLSVITIILTAAFLRCHMNKMKDTNTSGEVKQFNRVVHTMLRFLFLYFVFYATTFLYFFPFFAPYSVGYWINLTIVLSFVPVLYFLQILENPRWRTILLKMISCSTHRRETNTLNLQ
ncbi:taste receptor type 2 member 8-like [Phyllobates terribilis]|uniref:taste receptor type 2 member 8-like n=1 Tax=Phyllobates terribilis TaxID=111132 RepID=UPI003CCB3B32